MADKAWLEFLYAFRCQDCYRTRARTCSTKCAPQMFRWEHSLIHVQIKPPQQSTMLRDYVGRRLEGPSHCLSYSKKVHGMLETCIRQGELSIEGLTKHTIIAMTLKPAYFSLHFTETRGHVISSDKSTVCVSHIKTPVSVSSRLYLSWFILP